MPRVEVRPGLELEYDEIGQGRPLVLIMGIGAQMILWRDEFRQALADRGYRVIRFDSRDVGLSSKLSGQRVPSLSRLVARRLLGRPIEAPYTLIDMADDTVGLLDALGIERAHVVGLSLGGMIAQCAAIRHPERTASLTSIMSTTGEIPLSLPTPGGLRALVGKPVESAADAVENARRFYRACGSKGFEIDWAWAERISAAAYERSYYPAGFLRQFAAMLATPPRSAALRFCRVPTAVVHGTADTLVPVAGGRATARAVPGATLHLVEGMGHDLPRGAWPQVIDAIDQVAIRAA